MRMNFLKTAERIGRLNNVQIAYNNEVCHYENMIAQEWHLIERAQALITSPNWRHEFFRNVQDVELCIDQIKERIVYWYKCISALKTDCRYVGKVRF